MTKREVATLAFKVLALWLCVQAIVSFGNLAMGVVEMVAFFGDKQYPHHRFSILYGAPAPVIKLVLGVMIWGLAGQIARSIFPKEELSPDEALVRVEPGELLMVAFAAIGMYVLVEAIPAMARSVVAIFTQQVTYEKSWRDLNWQIRIGTEILQLVMGLFLLIGARGIARLFGNSQRSQPRVRRV